jgi:hypothetical protein
MAKVNVNNIENWTFVTGTPRSGTTFVGMVLSLPLDRIRRDSLSLDERKPYSRFSKTRRFGSTRVRVLLWISYTDKREHIDQLLLI